ncbi:hypothetical protein [Sphingomonas soli]|uniref:hypothetical protein n=1 Tax=Sphingomonas soli TaxID=266127 RepID=UPI00083231A2|nr:hypothetical protein [Sphingomonas soli]
MNRRTVHSRHTSMRFAMAGLAAAVSMLAGSALAQEATAQAAPTAQAPGPIGSASGTGKWPAIAQLDASLETHTLYRPERLPAEAMPLVIWGNGGCRNHGLRYAMFLREIASHGYFVIALGRPGTEMGVRGPTSPDAGPRPGYMPGNDETEYTEMLDAIDWATRETAREGSAFHQRIDTSRIAVMGHSCGAVQAIATSADPRVKTTVSFNAGVLERDGPRPERKIALKKEALQKIRGPIAYFAGGPGDVGHLPAADNAERIKHVPVFFGELPVGHTGTFWADTNGGEWGRVGAWWLNWQLKGDEEAAKWFGGADCRLCKDPAWTVGRKAF